MSKSPTSSNELEIALIESAKQSYIALMNTDIKQAEAWYQMTKQALKVLGPERANAEMRKIMSEFLNGTREMNIKVLKQVMEKMDS